MLKSVLHPVIRSAFNLKKGLLTLVCWFSLFISANAQVTPVLNLNSTGNASLNLASLNLNDCFTSTPYTPTAAVGDGHAMWLSNNPFPSSTTDFVFSAGASFIENADGTATLKGTLTNTGNPLDQWEVNLYLSSKSNWAQWSGLGRTYKDESGLIGNNYTNWSYYIENPNLTSTIIGLSGNSGKTVEITHMPANYNFGFQVGTAANNKNSGFGLSGWFSYSLDGQNYHQGDFNLDLAQVQRVVNHTASQTTFDCSNLGLNTITITSTDQFGETCTQQVDINIKDVTPPVVVTKNVIRTLMNGTVTISANDVLDFNCSTGGISSLYGPNSLNADGTIESIVAPNEGGEDFFFAKPCTSDNCSIASYVISKKTFDCSNIGENIVTATVTDQSGNVTTATAIVYIRDNTFPVAKAKNITVALDANGIATITPQMINNGSSDACGTISLSLNKTTFDCSNLGFNEVTLIVTDNSGNTKTATANVNVVDNTAPTVVTKNISLNLDEFGQASIADALDLLVLCDDAVIDIDNGGFGDGGFGDGGFGGGFVPGAGETARFIPAQYYQEATCTKDNCSITEVSVDITDFDCSNIGQNIVTVTVSDASGNSTSKTAIVTINDITPPTVSTKNITVNLDANGNAAITPAQIDNGSSDVCGVTLSLDKTSFGCSDVGTQTVILTATDASGNTTSKTATVTITDNTAPTIITKNITLPLDANGNVSLTAAQVDSGSYDNCGITLSIDKLSFDCNQVGTQTVTLTGTDPSGNSASAPATVTIVDNTAPTIITQNLTVALNANGNASITSNQVDNGTTDNCGIATIELSKVNFDCSNLGDNTVTVTATDTNGNVSTKSVTITVTDNTAPTIITKNISVTLDANGNASITAAQVDNGSFDNCDITLSIDKFAFDCSDEGPQTVTLTGTDASGNSASASAIVTVINNNAPEVVTNNITVSLDASGNASISASDLIDNAVEICTVVPYDGYSNHAVSFKNYYPNDNNWIDFKFDANGGQLVQYADGTAMVIGTIVNKSDPNDIWVAQLNLDQKRNWTEWSALGRSWKGDANIVGNNYKDWSYYQMSTTIPSTFTGGGNNTGQVKTITHMPGNYNYGFQVGQAANDKNGNYGMSGWFFYTNGQGQSVGGDFNMDISSCTVSTGTGSCDPESIEINKADFDCNDLGENTVTLTVTDSHGNTTTKTSVVTIVDDITPTVLAKDITVALDANGNANITAAQIDNGSSDNCNLTLTVDKTSFSCNDIGTQTVTLTGTDASGNTASATAIVTIVDNTAPNVITQNISVSLNASGNAIITAAQINNGSSDNCGIESITVSKTSFDCSNLGDNTVTLTVTDNNGNTSTKTATVTIVDNIAPIVIAQDITVALDANGNANITAAQVDNGSSDNCNLTLTVDKTSFSCNDIGTQTVTLTGTDASGNTASATAIVTIVDNTAPNVITQNISVSLNASGNAIITAAQINNGSSDNCGIESITVSKTSFDCSNLGDNTVTLTVTDNNGNTSTKTATVTIVDNIAPIVIAQDITVALDANGNANITAAQVDNGSSDNCNITLTVDKTSFDCNDLGNKTVTLTGTDASGNSASATATVTVIDNIAPVITVNNNITVEVDENGSATITQSQVVTSVGDDNCGSVNITISKTSFDCTDLGTNTITVTATDASGNVTTKTVTVTVVDSSAPVFTNPTSGSVISQNPTAPAMDFNVFVRNNVSFKNNETEGAVALGGDLSIDGSYQVSTNSTGSFKVNNVPVTLVVGGKVNYNSGNSLQVNQNGYVKIGNANGSKVWYQDQNGANSPIRITKDNNYNSSPRLHLQANAQQLGVNASNNPIFESNVIDFEAAFAQMEASALSMSQLANNANLTNPNGQPISNTNLPNQVKINLQDGLNVLNVTGSDLNNVSVFTFNNQPSQSKILIINVDNPGTFNWNVYNTGGIGEHVSPYILYNFYNSTTVKIQGNGSIIGTVFAPFAFINKTSHNNISGQVIGKSFTQLSGENHMFGFSGTITSGTTTEIEEGSTVVRNADDCTYEVQGPEFTPAVTDNGCADVSLTYALSGATTGSGTDLSGVSLNVGQTVITWTATDGSNTTTFSITVDVEDNTAPTVLAKNITVALDANGNANITAAQVDNGSSDNCNLTLSIDKLSFDCNDIGTQTVTLTGTDANGNATMATATVTVVDNIAPTIVADNITIEINENGSASLTQEQLITSITSNNCGDVTLSISKTSFDCTNLGQNVVTITATDSHGNSSNTSITVTVIDNVAPVWIGPGVGGSSSAAMNPTAPAMDFNIFIKNNLTLKQNEAEGAVALGGDLTHNGYFQVSTNSLGSFKVNNVPVSLLVGGKVNYSGGYSLKVNQYGYIKIGNANGSKVWYQDRNNAYSPIRITKDNNYYSSPLIELQANAQQLGVSASNNPVFESGLIDFNEAFAQLETNSLALSQLENNADLTNANGQSISNTNLPNQVKINLHDGVNVLNLTGDDLNRVSTFTFNNQPNQDRILVINVNSPGSLNWNVYNSAGIGENVAPYIIYNFYNTTFLQVQGNGSVIGSLLAPYAEINKTSWNNISGQIIAKSMTQHGGETHMFAFAGTIGSQNNSSTETIEDGETVSRNTEDCAYTVAGNEFTPSIGDNSCANLYLSYALSGATTGSGTDLSGVSLNVGQTVITWTATDGSNTTTFSITVDVEDNTAPTVLAKDITVALDANGNANITAAQVDNGSSDNCNLTLSVDKTSFNCSDLGTQTVTLTGTDANGNSATATTIVTVVDNTAPNVITQDISVSLNASGNAIITAAQINNGSSDNCGIESITVSKTSFDCSNLGDNTVTLTVTDNNGNTSTKTATVTIVDNIAPVFTSAPTNKVYQAENGNCNLQAYWTVPVVSDNCNVTLTSTHNPGDVFPVGTTTVTYTATDAGGNSVSTSFNVTVQASPMNVVLQADTYTTASGIYNTTCSGAEDGKVMLAVTGGCGPYTYLWSNGSTSKDLNGVEAGTYSVTVTDNNGTQIQKSITLTSPTAIEVEKVVTTEQTLTGYGDANTIYLGFGEQTAVLQANATGGSGDYTYTWSPNEEIACSFENTVTVAPQVTTTYTVVVTDSNGCSTTESFTINVIDVRCDDYNAPGGSNGGGNDDDDDDNNGGGDNGEVFDCQCEGKMKNFTVVYNGFSGVTIKAYKKDKKTVIKTFNNVQNGEEIQVTGFDHKGRLDSKTYLEIGSAKYEIHTSCSINIMGETYGPFTVIEFTDGDGATCSGNGTPSTANFTGSVAPIVSHSGGYTYGDDDDDDNYRDDDDDDNYRDDDDDDNHTHNSTCGHDDDDDNGSTPGSDCQCEGRMENFTVVYQGQSGKTVKAYNKKMDYLIETYYNVQYGDTLVVEGFDKHDRLESKTMLMVDWTSYEVHTSCSINILGSEIGPFKVVAYTDGEGFTCSLPSEDGNNDGGGNSSGCNVDTINWTGNVTICYNGQTYCVTQEEAENYLALGASLGSCSFNITASSKGIAAKATGENTDINTEIKFEVSTYPNPASDLANITFNVNQDGPVTVAIFDTKGLQVGNTLFEENAEIDRKYTVVFDASSVKEGIYIIRLRTAGYIESKKLMIKK